MQNITSDFHIKLKRGQGCSQPEKGENTSYDKNSFGNESTFPIEYNTNASTYPFPRGVQQVQLRLRGASQLPQRLGHQCL